MQDLINDAMFLFLESMAVATAVEWLTDKMPERIYPNAIRQ